MHIHMQRTSASKVNTSRFFNFTAKLRLLDKEWTHKVVAGLWVNPQYDLIMDKIDTEDSSAVPPDNERESKF